MVQLKLKLNSRRPSRVRDTNGKSYLLKPGQNVLNLSYSDYMSLAAALGIKTKNEPATDNTTTDTADTSDTLTNNDKPTDDQATLDNQTDSDMAEPSSNLDDNDIQQKEPVKESVDYTTWSYTKLKAEYKSITGNPCKLKKDEVIAFLQEHDNA